MQVADQDGDTLERVARDGGMDYDKWPAILEPLLERLDKIVHNGFPIPTLPPWFSSQPPTSNSGQLVDQITPSKPPPSTSQSPPTAAKGTNPSPRPLPPVPPFSSSASRVPDSLPPSQEEALTTSTSGIPDLLFQQLNYITHTLRTSFSTKPPHTIQRLAELVLNPTNHYKTLPAWLRAVDRVVSVSSTADIFPLPIAPSLPGTVIDSSLTNGVANGVGSGTGGGGILWANASTNTNGFDSALGSDESLGGALLTPIPWLKHGINNIDDSESSPNSDPLGEPISTPASSSGDSMLREREDGAVTQGELIRQEQEAGVVPGNQTFHSRGNLRGEEIAMEDDDSVPHARGPELVGAEDIGLQGGKKVEVSIGRSAAMDSKGPEDEMQTDPAVKEADVSDAEMEIDGSGNTQGLEDIVLTDADGKTVKQGDVKADASS